MSDTPGIALPRKEWFDAHYHWAAGIIGEWIAAEIDIRSATLVDFGCGDGTTSLGVADRFGPKHVTGIDIRPSFQNIGLIAEQMAPTRALPPNLSFLQIDPAERLADRVAADVVFSWSCFEHIERRHLVTIFRDIYDLLPIGGLLFVQIEPLYYSPQGAHLSAYVEQPWHHLLVSDEELAEHVRRAEPRDSINARNATVPIEQKKNFHLRQYATLNRLTADELLRIGRDAGFAIKREVRTRLDLTPPAALIQRLGADALLTNEIRVLFKKTRRGSAEHLLLEAKEFARRARAR